MNKLKRNNSYKKGRSIKYKIKRPQFKPQIDLMTVSIAKIQLHMKT